MKERNAQKVMVEQLTEINIQLISDERLITYV